MPVGLHQNSQLAKKLPAINQTNQINPVFKPAGLNSGSNRAWLAATTPCQNEFGVFYFSRDLFEGFKKYIPAFGRRKMSQKTDSKIIAVVQFRKAALRPVSHIWHNDHVTFLKT